MKNGYIYLYAIELEKVVYTLKLFLFYELLYLVDYYFFTV